MEPPHLKTKNVGRPSFNVLQNQMSERPALHLYAFDLLALRGKDLAQEPLEIRRKLLRSKVMPRLPDYIRYSETLEASPAELIEAVREQGLRALSRSGATAWRADYPSRRSW
jgi:bifunctional non-homologous end joining protein LigD